MSFDWNYAKGKKNHRNYERQNLKKKQRSNESKREKKYIQIYKRKTSLDLNWLNKPHI